VTLATRLRELDQLRALLPSAQPERMTPAQLAERVGLTPDEWQRRLLESTADRILLNASRQSGKSSMVAVLAVATALYEPGALVLLLSPTLRQSGELFKKAAGIYRDLGRPVAAESETALTLTLANRSRIVSLPGDEQTVRGYSGVRLLAIDEASRVADSLFYSVTPMLSVSRGRLVALSTPFGTRGWWHESWRGPEPWERYEVPATMCPRIPADFLEQARRDMGEWWFDQEFMCRFLDAVTQLFTRADVDAAFERPVEAWDLRRPA